MGDRALSDETPKVGQSGNLNKEIIMDMEYTEAVELGQKIESLGGEEKMDYPEFYLHDKEVPQTPDGDFVIKAKVCKASVNYDEDGNVQGCSFYVKSIKFPKKSDGYDETPEKKISAMIDDGVEKMRESY